MNEELNKMKRERDQLKADWAKAYREDRFKDCSKLAKDHDSLEKRIMVIEGVGVPPESQRDIWTVGI